MPHQEYRDLITRGETSLIGYPTPLADIVDEHIAECAECQNRVFGMLWKRCRQNPWKYGPLSTRAGIGYFKKTNLEHSKLDMKRNAPMSRIARVIIFSAIDDSATQVRIYPVLDESAYKTSIRRKPMQENASVSSHYNSTTSLPPEQLTKMMTDTICYQDQASLDGKALQVDQMVMNDWQHQQSLPSFITEPLTLKYKQLADLRLTLTTATQRGEFVIDYRENDYKVVVETSQSDLGETITLTFSQA
ncbi:MAG: hypothetical protein ABJA67_01740 [Chthonomonadales bacterium]